MPDSHAVLVLLPIELHDRASKIAKKVRTSISQLVRDSLDAHVRSIEERLHADQRRVLQEREERRRVPRRESPLAPKPLTLTPAVVDAVEPKIADDIYHRQAKKILEAVDSPAERRARIAEAIEAVKNYFPLTYPSNEEILDRLNRAGAEILKTTPAIAAPVSSPPPMLSISDLVSRFGRKD